jgi:hypothetical protein
MAVMVTMIMGSQLYLLTFFGLSGNKCKQCATNDSGTNYTNYTR